MCLSDENGITESEWNASTGDDGIDKAIVGWEGGWMDGWMDG